MLKFSFSFTIESTCYYVSFRVWFTFSWSLKDKATLFPPGVLRLGRRARGRGGSGASPLLGAGDDDIDGTR